MKTDEQIVKWAHKKVSKMDGVSIRDRRNGHYRKGLIEGYKQALTDQQPEPVDLEQLNSKIRKSITDHLIKHVRVEDDRDRIDILIDELAIHLTKPLIMPVL